MTDDGRRTTADRRQWMAVGSSVAGRSAAHRIARVRRQLPQHRGLAQEGRDLGRLAVEQLGSQVVEERGQRWAAVCARQQIGDAAGRAAAQALPGQLQRDGPPLGLVGQRYDLGSGERHAVGITEERRDLLGLEREVAAADLLHLVLGPPNRHAGQGKRVTGGCDHVQVGRDVCHQAFEERADLRRFGDEMIVIQHQQGGPVEPFGQGVDERIHDTRPLACHAPRPISSSTTSGVSGRSASCRRKARDQVGEELLGVGVGFVEGVPGETYSPRPPLPAMEGGRFWRSR